MARDGGSATDLLMREASTFARKRLTGGVRALTDRVSDFGDRLDAATEEGGEAVVGLLAETARSLVPGVDGRLADLASSVRDRFGRDGGERPTHGTTIVEQIDVGVPARVAYDQWTQFTTFPSFAKGATRVEQQDDETVHWEAKVFWSRREWTSRITEQVPDKRIAWTSQGGKGTVDGAVTFHELAPELTRVLVVLEYHPKGMVEHVGNLWRAQGRRVRLDLKRFRSFVMQRGEQTGGWRGEIREGEVVEEKSSRGTSRRGTSSRGKSNNAESDGGTSNGGKGGRSKRRTESAGRTSRAKRDAPDEAYPDEPDDDSTRGRRRTSRQSGRTRER